MVEVEKANNRRLLKRIDISMVGEETAEFLKSLPLMFRDLHPKIFEEFVQFITVNNNRITFNIAIEKLRLECGEKTDLKIYEDGSLCIPVRNCFPIYYGDIKKLKAEDIEYGLPNE